jgi:uncharacterized membrane-anchored protein YitT (DUF2179 family)
VLVYAGVMVGIVISNVFIDIYESNPLARDIDIILLAAMIWPIVVLYVFYNAVAT